MTSSTFPLARIGLGLALIAAVGSLQAQGLDALKGLGGGSAANLSSLTSGSMGNAAGVIEYCVKNNYLSGASASSVKDKLLGKIGGGSPTSDSGYVDGAKGILTSSDGQKVDLSGGGLKAQLTKKACDVVLKQGKSML